MLELDAHTGGEVTSGQWREVFKEGCAEASFLVPEIGSLHEEFIGDALMDEMIAKICTDQSVALGAGLTGGKTVLRERMQHVRA